MAERRLGGRPDNREGGEEEGNGMKGILVRLIWWDLYLHRVLYCTAAYQHRKQAAATTTTAAEDANCHISPAWKRAVRLRPLPYGVRLPSALFRSAKDIGVRGYL